MWFSGDNLVLVAAQSACVALPAAGVPAWAERFRGRAWALVAPRVDRARRGRDRPRAVHGRRADVDRADPRPDRRRARAGVGDARGAPGPCAPGGAAARARLGESDSRAGQAATIVLIAGSAVTVGRLLAGAAPLSLLKAGIYAMAAVDAYLVFHEPAAAGEHRARDRRACPRAAPAAVLVVRVRGTRLRRLLRRRARRRHPRRAARAAAVGRAGRVRRVVRLGPAVPRLRRAARDRSPGARAARLRAAATPGTSRRRGDRAGGRPPRTGGRAARSPRTRCGARRGAGARARGARRRPRTSPG